MCKATKKLLFLVLPVVILVLSMATALASDPATVTVGSIQGLPGTNVDVPIDFSNSAGVGGGVITLTYDPTKVTPVGIIKNASLPWAVPEHRDDPANSYILDIIANLNHSANTIKIAWIVDPRVGLPVSGRLGHVRFQLNRMAGTAISVVSTTDNDFMLFTVEAAKLQPASVNGSLTGKDLDQVRYGNVKGSGVPNITDAVMCMRYRADLIDLAPNQIISGDVDGNSIINVQDAVLIMRHRAGLIPKFPVE